MNSTSPTLSACDSPPTIFPFSTLPPVVSVPPPSRTTQTSTVLGCTSAVSAFRIRRMLTLNLPPSIMRRVWSFFASMSFK